MLPPINNVPSAPSSTCPLYAPVFRRGGVGATLPLSKVTGGVSYNQLPGDTMEAGLEATTVLGR